MPMKYFTLILFAALNSSCNPNCDAVKIGTFELNSYDGSIHTIMRTEKTQTEFIEKSGNVVQYDLKWISPYAYQIFNRKLVQGTEDRKVPPINDTITFEIVKVDGNKHVVKAKLKGIDEMYEKTLTKIK